MIEGWIAEAGRIEMPDGHVYPHAVVVVFRSKEECRDAVKDGGSFFPFGTNPPEAA